jgi:hypothetical protein
MKHHFERQADYCSAFGADLTAQLLRQLSNCICASCALGQRIFNWPGDPAPETDSLPLRLAGGLHALLLSEKRVNWPRSIAKVQLPTPICKRSCKPYSSVTTLNLPPLSRTP